MEYPYVSFTFKGRIKSLIRAEGKFNGYIVEYIYDYYKKSDDEGYVVVKNPIKDKRY